VLAGLRAYYQCDRRLQICTGGSKQQQKYGEYDAHHGVIIMIRSGSASGLRESRSTLHKDNLAAYKTSAKCAPTPLCISERLTHWREILTYRCLVYVGL
jgi:hypothetical protein